MRKTTVFVLFTCALACQTVTLLLSAMAIPTFAAESDQAGYQSLFDGKTLDGWDGDPRFWRVEDGAITGETTKEQPTEQNTFIIWKGGTVGDFELSFEYRMRNHNSGVQYRSWRGEKPGDPAADKGWIVGGYQADMVVDTADAPYSGILYEERGRGILAMRGEKVVVGADHKPKVVGSLGSAEELLECVKRGEWKTYTVTASGNHLVHKINGCVTADIVDDDAEMRRSEGIVAFQLHAGPPMKVQFRNVRLRKLTGTDKQAVDNKPADKKKIVFIAGPKSHGYATHAHNAGCLLLAKRINEGVPQAQAIVCRDGWPQDESVLDDAAAIVVYSDGGDSHVLAGHFDKLESLLKHGAGLSLLHYAVELNKGKEAEAAKNWIGGYFEQHWSINPMWTAEFKSFPDHPIARGLKPFALDDEWYYNMRFIEGMEGVTPLLTALPPDSTRNGPDGSHSGNAAVRAAKGRPEHLSWARVRPDGGRGFGFTGGHWHANWADDNFRKLVLNSCLWVAGVEVPADGVESARPTLAELEAEQGYPKPEDYDNSREKGILSK